MGQMYTAIFDSVAVAAAQDFFEILGVADRVVEIVSWEIGQTSDMKDAEEEGLVIRAKRGHGSVTSGSGGSTPTAQPVDYNGAAFGGAVEANNTTKMVVGSGTIVQLGAHMWNNRVGIEKIYPEDARPTLNGAERFTLELAAAPADSLTVSGTITFLVR